MVEIEGNISVVQQDLGLTKILMYSQAMLCGECNYENSYRNSKDELKWPM